MANDKDQKQNTYAAKESEDSDTIHVHIENEDSLRSDLSYLAGKLGVNLEDLKKERYRLEMQAKQDEINKRQEKKLKAKEAQDAALEKQFLDEYGFKEGHYGITLNGRRIQNLKSLGEFKCLHCGAGLNLRGLAHLIVEWGQHTYAITDNPLSAWYGTPVRTEDVKCVNKHVNHVVVQYII
jgi:hypothetical protein